MGNICVKNIFFFLVIIRKFSILVSVKSATLSVPTQVKLIWALIVSTREGIAVHKTNISKEFDEYQEQNWSEPFMQKLHDIFSRQVEIKIVVYIVVLQRLCPPWYRNTASKSGWWPCMVENYWQNKLKSG